MDSYFCGTPNSFQSQIISTFYRVVITSLIQFGQRALITELSGANMSYFTCIFASSALILIHVGLRSFINVFFLNQFYFFLFFLPLFNVPHRTIGTWPSSLQFLFYCYTNLCDRITVFFIVEGNVEGQRVSALPFGPALSPPAAAIILYDNLTPTEYQCCSSVQLPSL